MEIDKFTLQKIKKARTVYIKVDPDLDGPPYAQITVSHLHTYLQKSKNMPALLIMPGDHPDIYDILVAPIL